MRKPLLVCLAALICIGWSGGYAGPNRNRMQMTRFPDSLAARGVRGIVRVEALVDPCGTVISAKVVQGTELPAVLQKIAVEAAYGWRSVLPTCGSRRPASRIVIPFYFRPGDPRITGSLSLVPRVFDAGDSVDVVAAISGSDTTDKSFSLRYSSAYSECRYTRSQEIARWSGRLKPDLPLTLSGVFAADSLPGELYIADISQEQRVVLLDRLVICARPDSLFEARWPPCILDQDAP